MKEYLNPITGEMNPLDLAYPNPGIYAGVSHAYYLAIDAVSRSDLKNFRDAPERYKSGESRTSDALIFGTQYHAFMFEPEHFEKRFVLGDVTASGVRGKAFKEQQEEHGAEYVYRPKDLEKIEAMYEALKQYPKSLAVLRNPNPKELTVVAHHAESGLTIKCKIDILIVEAGWIVDLKTTRDADPDKFKWSVRDYGYDLQSGFYVMCCQALPELSHVQDFAIIAQEKEPPYIVRRFNMAEHISDGIIESNRLLAELDSWLRTGRPLNDDMHQVHKYSTT